MLSLLCVLQQNIEGASYLSSTLCTVVHVHSVTLMISIFVGFYISTNAVSLLLSFCLDYDTK